MATAKDGSRIDTWVRQRVDGPSKARASIDRADFTLLSPARPSVAAARGQLSIRYPRSLGTEWLKDPLRDGDGLLAPRITPAADLQWDNPEVPLAFALRGTRSEGPVAPVPLTQSLPALSRLSAEQRAWYVWWREAWLRGWSGSTGLSYVYLAAYHLINGVWLEDRLEALDALIRLGRAYPQASRNLLRWAADLAWELGLDERALALYREVDDRIAALIAGQTREQAAADQWDETLQAIAHNPYPSAHRDQYLEELVPLWCQAVADGDGFFGPSGLDLLSRLGSPWGAGERVHPYPTVPRYRVVRTRPIDLPKRTAFPVNPAIKAFLRAVENKHRQAVGNRARLRVNLAPKIARFIEERHATWPTLAAYLTPTDAHDDAAPPVRLDRAQLAVAASEAQAVRALVNDFLGVDEQVDAATPPRATGDDDWTLDAFLTGGDGGEGSGADTEGRE